MGAIRDSLGLRRAPKPKAVADGPMPRVGKQDKLLVARQALKGLYKAPSDSSPFDDLLNALEGIDK